MILLLGKFSFMNFLSSDLLLLSSLIVKFFVQLYPASVDSSQLFHNQNCKVISKKSVYLVF